MTLEVLERFLDEATPLLAVAAAGLLFARRRQWLLPVPAVVYAAGSVGMLDSVNRYSRLFLPVWPLLTLLAGIAVAAAHRRLGRAGAPVAVGLTLLLVATALAPGPGARSFAMDYARCPQHARLEAARWLRANTAPGTVYSISDSGLVPLRARGRVAEDQLRLNDSQMQRTGRLPLPRETDQVYDPGLEVLGLASGNAERLEGRYVAARTMPADRRFSDYALAHVARGH